jgi:copper chaperone CopZ
METKHYQTTINCPKCIKAVSAFIEEVPNIDHWEVDIANPNKMLTVTGENIDWHLLQEAVLDAGYDIQEVSTSRPTQTE